MDFTVAGHKIKLVYTNKLKLDNEDCWGSYDDDKRTIYMRYKMDECRKADTFLHEIIHSIDFIHNLNLSEKAVNILAIELVAFIRNNKLPLLRKIMKVK